MTLFMETTEIAPERTVQEIEKALVAHKASAILKEYGATGDIEAVSFRYRTPSGDVPFRLPCRWLAIAELLRKRAKISDYSWKSTYGNDARRRAAIYEKAKRVAWRQVLRWVEAQLALVETQMVTAEEVFLPYAQLAGGQTIYEALQARGFAQLEFKEGT